jgi:divinyl chlorophyllide a 8-vinyl-reductase
MRLQEFAGANVVFGDVTSLDSLRATAFKQPVDVVVSCLASRTGGKKDSWDIDYQVGVGVCVRGCVLCSQTKPRGSSCA